MRLLIQRVKNASVAIEGKIKSTIDAGLLVLVGIEHDDTDEDIQYLSQKLVNLRIFDDENGVMNLSVIDAGGEIMIVSQFTLHARTRKGNRPSYVDAAKPEIAIPRVLLHLLLHLNQDKLFSPTRVTLQLQQPI